MLNTACVAVPAGTLPFCGNQTRKNREAMVMAVGQLKAKAAIVNLLAQLTRSRHQMLLPPARMQLQILMLVRSPRHAFLGLGP
jgi:hypothetical protein